MTANESIVIGTRGSALALWQADHVTARLQSLFPGLSIGREIIVTTGDRFQAGPVESVGGKAVWVKEIEEALLDGRIDLAVHSLKDVPSELPPGLVLAAFPARADARDAFLSPHSVRLSELPHGARVGTSSPRRAAQLRALRPDVAIELLRGNVDTRLRKLSEGQVDAALLACAGLDRLGFADRIRERLSPEVMVPAIGQGALAIEVRAGDERVAALVGRLDDRATAVAISAERALLAGLGGSCRTPIGGHARLDGGAVRLTGLVGHPDGREIIRVEEQATPETAAALGARVAELLRARGAERLLAELG